MSLSYKPLLEAFVAKLNAITAVTNIETNSAVTNERLECLRKHADVETKDLFTLIENATATKAEIDGEMKKLDPLLRKIEPEMRQIEELKKVIYLLQVLQKVKECHEKLERNLNQKGLKQSETDNKVLVSVELLHSISEECIRITAKLADDNPFKGYFINFCTHWNSILQKRLEQIFEVTLKQISWPVSSSQIKSPSISPELHKDFDTQFIALLKLECVSQFESIRTSNCKQIKICLPMKIMVAHFQKRFVFHFMTNSKTNRLEKPEWYLTQVLNWIKDHEHFLRRYVDPIFLSTNSLGKYQYSSGKLQLSHGLLKLIETKLESDLPDLVADDKLFSHAFDEFLLFVKEIEPIFNFNKNLLNENCRVMQLFGSEQYFTKLMKLEKKKSVEFVENILNSESAWFPLLTSVDDEDELKVPECADNFVLMIQAMKERFSHFPHGNHRCAFMDLILELLDDFRLRMSQLKNVSENEEFLRWPFTQQYFSIVNTLNYFIIVLEEWKHLQVFIEIAEELKSGLFDESTVCLKHMLREMQSKIVTSLMNQVKVKLYNYSKIKWFCNSFEEEVDVALYDMLYFISSALETLHRNVAKKISEELTVVTIEEINKTLLEEVILKCTFSVEGAKRLMSDVTTNLVSVLRVFMKNPEIYLTELIEACRLLNLERGTTLLLQEVIKFNNENAIDESLKEVSVKVLSTETASRILRNKLLA